jgi:hypothetical protein
MELPNFCVNKTAKELVAGEAGKAGGGEGRLRVG